MLFLIMLVVLSIALWKALDPISLFTGGLAGDNGSNHIVGNGDSPKERPIDMDSPVGSSQKDLPGEGKEGEFSDTTKEGTNYRQNGRILPENHSYSYKADLEATMVDLVNEHRKNNGVGVLQVRGDLRDSARYKSLSMLQLNYFSHDNP
ncbi:MAG TPA: hypothetical protein VFD57_05015, partial [Clostridia bacterium]|nr:hypothetical protein [Clostridia bacterium]